ncbi:MAG: hypothetical protein U9R74_13355 [Pseudomonadota bacterium]|nr:hypothetical protein [Pseudomonadota bacterium]
MTIFYFLEKKGTDLTLRLNRDRDRGVRDMYRTLIVVSLFTVMSITVGCSDGEQSAEESQVSSFSSASSGLKSDDPDVSKDAGGTGETASTPDTSDAPGIQPDIQINISDGHFVDSAVEGISYSSAGLAGTTDTEGVYQYEEGALISFYIGDLHIGEAVGASVLTPVDLVQDARDETDTVVTNVSRFLQTLDDDGDASNGILIPPRVSDQAHNRVIDFRQTEEAFEDDGSVQILVAELTALTNAGARALISAEDARDHLRTSLLKLHMGVYSGSFDGDESGTFVIEVNEAGGVSGMADLDSCSDSDADSGGGGSSSQCSSHASSGSGNSDENSVNNRPNTETVGGDASGSGDSDTCSSSDHGSGTSSSSCSSQASSSSRQASTGLNVIDSSGAFSANLNIGDESVVFSGSVNREGVLSGAWQSETSTKSGTLKGRRETPTE